MWYHQVQRLISITQLSRLAALTHVTYQGRGLHPVALQLLKNSFDLICFQILSLTHVATLRYHHKSYDSEKQQIHQRCAPNGPFVLTGCSSYSVFPTRRQGPYRLLRGYPIILFTEVSRRGLYLVYQINRQIRTVSEH